jgi:hypothetical protein
MIGWKTSFRHSLADCVPVLLLHGAENPSRLTGVPGGGVEDGGIDSRIDFEFAELHAVMLLPQIPVVNAAEHCVAGEDTL